MGDTSRFKPGDRVVYRPAHHPSDAEEGTVTSVGERYVFVCYGLPGSTAQATDPVDLQLVSWRDGGES